METSNAFLNDNNTFGDVSANIEVFDESEEQEELVEPRFRYKRVLGDLMRVNYYLKNSNKLLTRMFIS